MLLGGLFVVLALSLFGMYELTLPNFWSGGSQAKQSKGGVVGTIFGALAFTIISFTCVAPFLGGFAGISAADAAAGTSSACRPRGNARRAGLRHRVRRALLRAGAVPGLLKALPQVGRLAR